VHGKLKVLSKLTVHNNKNILLYPVGDKIKCVLWGFSFTDFINSNGI
jgi:hypothetical protein